MQSAGEIQRGGYRRMLRNQFERVVIQALDVFGAQLVQEIVEKAIRAKAAGRSS